MSLLAKIMRLLAIGTGTVLGMTILIAPFVSMLTTEFGLPLFQLAMVGAGMTIIFGVIPSFMLWFLAVWLLAKTRLSPRRVPVVASAVTAVAGAFVITYALTGFAYPSGFGIWVVLAALSAAIAGVLTLVLFPLPVETSQS